MKKVTAFLLTPVVDETNDAGHVVSRQQLPPVMVFEGEFERALADIAKRALAANAPAQRPSPGPARPRTKARR